MPISAQNKPDTASAASDQKVLDNRTFGLIFAAIFLIIALFPLLFGNGLRNWALIVTGAFTVTALALPSALSPLNKLWAKFGMLMHKVTNPLLMGLVFFITVLPTGIILKLLGKDPMRRKRDESAESYWIERQPSSIKAEFFNQQF